MFNNWVSGEGGISGEGLIWSAGLSLHDVNPFHHLGLQDVSVTSPSMSLGGEVQEHTVPECFNHVDTVHVSKLRSRDKGKMA